jgi:8-oxo-dGTP diphosphatase
MNANSLHLCLIPGDQSVIFTNTPNQCLSIDGKEYWISRSITVIGVLFFVVGDRVYVPLGLRGNALPDEVGKWGLPGGYLDYDETVGGALLREVWEELGLNLLDLQSKHRFLGSLEQPYFIFSDPIRLQNVTLRFPLLFFVDHEADLPSLQPKVQEDEVAQTHWFTLKEALGMDLAFCHQDVMQHCLDHCFSTELKPFV